MLAPVLVIFLRLAFGSVTRGIPLAGFVIGGINVLLVLCGLVLAVVALCSIRRHGKKGILAYSIVGLTVNAIFLAGIVLSVAVASKSIEKTKELQEMRRQQQEMIDRELRQARPLLPGPAE